MILYALTVCAGFLPAQPDEAITARLLYVAHLNRAQEAWQAGDVARAIELLNQHRPGPGREDLRGFEWFYLWRLCHSDAVTLRGHTAEIDAVAFSPDGKTVASVARDRTLRLWDIPAGKERAVLAVDATGRLVFSRDGKVLAVGEPGTTTCKGGRRHTTSRLSLWDPAAGRKLNTIELQHDIDSLAFAPDGKTLAVGCFGGVRLLDAAMGRELAAFQGNNWATYVVVFSPDGKRLVSGGRTVWDVRTRLELIKLDGGGGSPAFFVDGRTVAVVGGDGVRLYRAATDREVSAGGR